MGVSPDCNRCGACCRAYDDEPLPKESTAKIGAFDACGHLRFSEEGFKCDIYETRPERCRPRFFDSERAREWCDFEFSVVFKGKRC